MGGGGGGGGGALSQAVPHSIKHNVTFRASRRAPTGRARTQLRQWTLAHSRQATNSGGRSATAACTPSGPDFWVLSGARNCFGDVLTAGRHRARTTLLAAKAGQPNGGVTGHRSCLQQRQASRCFLAGKPGGFRTHHGACCHTCCLGCRSHGGSVPLVDSHSEQPDRQYGGSCGRGSHRSRLLHPWSWPPSLMGAYHVRGIRQRGASEVDTRRRSRFREEPARPNGGWDRLSQRVTQ